MKVVIQRVKEAKVEVENKVVGKIKKGFLELLTQIRRNKLII